MSKNMTDLFIDDLDTLRRTQFSDSIINQAKRCLLDYLGATFAGARMIKEKGNRLLEQLTDSSSGVSVIGFNKKAGISDAALINGLSSHAAELDDGVISGIIHPGAPIFSALLPVAEKEKSKGGDFLQGVIVGYEAAVRIADTIQPNHKKCGYHATGTCGIIGAAVSIAVMLGFSKAKLKDAVSAAAVSAAGSLKVLKDDSELKPFNVAKASHGGLIAAYIANTGFSGPDDVFSGTMGFLSMMTNGDTLSKLKNSKNELMSVERVYVKPYAACRYCHSAIEAAIKIKSNYNVQVKNIKNILVKTYQLSVTNHDHTTINSISSAKMSIPYSVAVSFVTGKAGINEYIDEFIKDKNISLLCKKISVIPDDELTALFPEKSASIVEVETLDGEKYIQRVDYPKGEPDNPMSIHEIEEKLIILAQYNNKTAKQSKEIIDIVRNIEEDIHNLFHLL